MSQWTHPMCDQCWKDLRGEYQTPVRMGAPEVERCCWCGEQTSSGIYVREDPSTPPEHQAHTD